jgi:hypothetical protein
VRRRSIKLPRRLARLDLAGARLDGSSLRVAFRAPAPERAAAPEPERAGEPAS